MRQSASKTEQSHPSARRGRTRGRSRGRGRGSYRGRGRGSYRGRGGSKNRNSKHRKKNKRRSNKNVPEEDIDKKLFVGGLFPDTTSEDLSTYFQKFGKIASVRVIGEDKKKPRGYAFVTFEEAEALQKVLQEKHTIRGRIVDCNHAAEGRESNKSDGNIQNKIYVSEIPVDLGKKKLKNHFEQFGEILEILLVLRKNKDKAFSFIEF